jgi:hypothetical protein
MVDNTIQSALETIKQTAEKVQYCPSCHGDHIYSAVNVAYIYDHQTQNVGVREILNLAENGWHGCFACGHKWVSNLMLQTALPLGAPSVDKSNVIDLPRCTKHKPSTDG